MKYYNDGNVGADYKIIGNNFSYGKGTTWNDYCWFNAKFGITIGENTLIGPYVIINSTNHTIRNIKIKQNTFEEMVDGEKIVIGNDVWIGCGCIILAGVIIPNNCVIGAGTIVTKSQSMRLNEGDIVCNDATLKIIGNRIDK